MNRIWRIISSSRIAERLADVNSSLDRALQSLQLLTYHAATQTAETTRALQSGLQQITDMLVDQKQHQQLTQQQHKRLLQMAGKLMETTGLGTPQLVRGIEQLQTTVETGDTEVRIATLTSGCAVRDWAI